MFHLVRSQVGIGNGNIKYSLLQKSGNEDKISNNNTNGGYEYGSQNTQLLEESGVPADGGSNNLLREQGTNSRKLAEFLGILREDEGKVSQGLRAGESGWIFHQENKGQKQAGYNEGLLRRISRIKPSGKDTIGRTVSKEIVDSFADMNP